MNEPSKKLYRSRVDRIIAGVCGGLGEYFNIDPVIFRVIFVILALTGGSGILLYLIMVLVVPKEGEGEGIDLSKEKVRSAIKESAENLKKEAEKFTAYHKERHEYHRHNSRALFAYFLIGIGVLLLINQIVPMPWLGGRFIWPLILIVFGAWLLMRK